MLPAGLLKTLRAHDLNQLTVLQALLATQSVTRAAQQLDLSQPALSKSLDRLRRQFDDPLLVRDGNRMRLTPRAQQLLPLLDAVLGQLAGVFAVAGPFDPALARGRVRIGANDYVQLVLGGRLLRRVRERAPQVVLDFRPVGMLHPEQLLVDGLVDIVIGPKWPNLSLRWQSLYRDPFVCLAGPERSDLPATLQVADFSAQAHLDVSPSGIGMLRTMIDRAGRAGRPARAAGHVLVVHGRAGDAAGHRAAGAGARPHRRAAAARQRARAWAGFRAAALRGVAVVAQRDPCRPVGGLGA